MRGCPLAPCWELLLVVAVKTIRSYFSWCCTMAKPRENLRMAGRSGDQQNGGVWEQEEGERLGKE